MRQFEIWLGDLNPTFGTEAGQIRPVLIKQNNMLTRNSRKSTLICPLTTILSHGVTHLPTRVSKELSKLLHASDILIDQIMAIDNVRVVKKIEALPDGVIMMAYQNLIHILGLKN